MKLIKKNKVGSVMALALAMCGALLLAVGCMSAEPEDQESSEAPDVSETSQAVTASFLSTCHEDGYTTNSQPVRAITHAWARSGCFTERNTVGPPQDWRGLCFTDMKNCNGYLVCGRSCP